MDRFGRQATDMRLSVTDKGNLRWRSTLLSTDFVLLGLLRSGAHDDELVDRWQDAMWAKPRAHGMDHG